MKLISRKYGVVENHLRYVIFDCCIKEQDVLENHRNLWRAKREWTFELIKYELQDHCTIRFKGIRDKAFIVKMLDISEHTIYDDLYKHDSDEYVKNIILLHISSLFENVYSLKNFHKYSDVFEYYIEPYYCNAQRRIEE